MTPQLTREMTTTQQPFTAEAVIEGVPATPLVGEELLNRIAELEVAGVEPKDVLIRCGYYVEGGDYGKANIDFFDAKLKAQKANGSWKPWTPPSAENLEQEEEETLSKEDAIECLKEELADNQLGNEDLRSKVTTYLILDGGASDRVKSIINDFCNSIEVESRYEDVLSNEEFIEVTRKYILQEEKEKAPLRDPYFDFLSLYFGIDCEEGDSQWQRDWKKALMMMEVVKRHPEIPGLRKKFTKFMGNSTEAGMEHSAFLSFKEPVWGFIKDVFDSRDIAGILAIHNGGEVDCSDYVEEVAEVLEVPEVIADLKDLGYTIKPRTPESIARAAEQVAKVAAQEKAQREAYEKEYNSVPKEQRDREEAFFTALSDCDFDELISKAEEYKPLLIENIIEFAGNFTSECSYEATGEEPQWLLQALLKGGAKLSGVSAQSSVALKGKKVCVTGKLQLKRAEVERQLVIKGAKVVGNVSRTTDLLIVGVDAGSKLDKAKTLGVIVLTEEEAIEQGLVTLATD